MKSSRFLDFFIRHNTAANLLMILMIGIGLVSLDRLNRQFFPSFDLELIVVSVTWTGATAEDMDANVVQPLEPELRSITGVKKVISNSYENTSQINVEFDFGTDMKQALADVESAVGLVEFPLEAETPKVIKPEFLDRISTLVLSGPYSVDSLRAIAGDIEEDLQRLGVDKITVKGLPDRGIWIEVSEVELARLGMSLNDIASILRRASLDVPAGRLADGALRVRSLGLARTIEEYENLELIIRPDGSRVLLSDVADLRATGYSSSYIPLTRNGQRAVEIIFQRGKSDDSLEINDVIQDWLADFKRTAPESLTIEQYDVRANLIKDRISLLVKNGASGLVLVLLVLFLFLSVRVAFWVAVGIPVAFLATFGVMLVMGQSINMISLFGLIMALGIVVDDAIVIGEHTEYLNQQRGLPFSQAAAVAATRMGPPVVCAMLTTVAAFLPLFTVKGIIGEIIVAIPLVVVAVLIASLFEVFFILPSHLAHSGKQVSSEPSGFRRGFDRVFNGFRDGGFRRAVGFAVRWRFATLATAIALLFISIGMIAGGRVNFVFFTSPEADVAHGNIIMAAGSSRGQTAEMLVELERALNVVEQRFTDGEGGLIQMALTSLGSTIANDDEGGITGVADNEAGIIVELLTADKRDIRMRDFIKAWQDEVRPIPGVERITIRAPEGGPPGRDLDIRLMGDDLDILKQAALAVVDIAKSVPSASAVTENLSYGAEERIIRLTPFGKALGFTSSSVGQQLRAALDGAVVTRFPDGNDEVTVRVTLPLAETATDNIGNLLIVSPKGQHVQLKDVADVENRLGFSVVRRQDGFREVSITADLDESVITTPEALEKVRVSGLEDIANQYNLRYRFDGRNSEQAESFADMGVGALMALVGIYVILAWVFSSWMLPLPVMMMIPFALIGAVWGHYVMGLTMTILSMFALIALAGIVVNNSIILVTTIERRLQDHKDDPFAAIISGTTDRLRPVILTSFTTIGGLSALMFERSLQAQFLIPMATTIVFGLAVTTLLVLFVVPATLAIGEDLRRVRGQVSSLAKRMMA